MSNTDNSSKLPAALQASEEDIQLLLSAQCHLGTKNCDKTMEPYVWKRRADGELRCRPKPTEGRLRETETSVASISSPVPKAQFLCVDRHHPFSRVSQTPSLPCRWTISSHVVDIIYISKTSYLDVDKIYPSFLSPFFPFFNYTFLSSCLISTFS